MRFLFNEFLLRNIVTYTAATLTNIKRLVPLLALPFLVTTLLFGLPAPSTLVSYRGITESVDITTTSPSLNEIYIESAYDLISERCVSDITLVPETDAVASYSRRSGGTLDIFLDQNWSAMGNTDITSPKEDYWNFSIGDRKRDCPVPTMVRLPASGFLNIGSENTASPNLNTMLALHHDLTISARSVGKLFGFIPLDFGPFKSGQLYFVESVALPAGSRLASVVGFDEKPTIWWGWVDARFDAKSSGSDDSMQLFASANASKLEVFAPAPQLTLSHTEGSVRSTQDSPVALKPDIYSLSSSARLLRDPNLQWLYALLAAAILISQLFPRLQSSKPDNS